jgi:hypothetical protein
MPWAGVAQAFTVYKTVRLQYIRCYTFVYTSGDRYSGKVHCRESLDPTCTDFRVYRKPRLKPAHAGVGRPDAGAGRRRIDALTRGMDDLTPGWRETRRVGVPVSLNSSSSTRRGNYFFFVTTATSIYKTLFHRSLM